MTFRVSQEPGRKADHIIRSSTGLKSIGAVPPFPHMPLWCAEGQPYLRVLPAFLSSVVYVDKILFENL